MGASYLTWFPPSSASLVQLELSAPWQSSSNPFWVSLFHLQLSSAPSSLGQHNPAVSLMGASYLTWFLPSSASLVQLELSAPWQSSSTPFWVSLFHLQLSSAPSSLGFISLPVSTPPRRSSLCTLQGLLVPDPAPSFWVLPLLTWVPPPQAVPLPPLPEVFTSLHLYAQLVLESNGGWFHRAHGSQLSSFWEDVLFWHNLYSLSS